MRVCENCTPYTVKVFIHYLYKCVLQMYVPLSVKEDKDKVNICHSRQERVGKGKEENEAMVREVSI